MITNMADFPDLASWKKKKWTGNYFKIEFINCIYEIKFHGCFKMKIFENMYHSYTLIHFSIKKMLYQGFSSNYCRSSEK